MAMEKMLEAPPADAQLQAWEFFLRAFGQLGWQSQLILSGLLVALLLIVVTNLPGALRRWRDGPESAPAREDAPDATSQVEGLVRVLSDIIEELGVQLRSLRDSVDQHATYSIQAQTALLETVGVLKELILTIQEQNHIIGTSVMAQQERFAAFAKTMKRCEICHDAHAPAGAA